MRRLERRSLVGIVVGALLLGAALVPQLRTGAQPVPTAAPGDPTRPSPIRETLLQAVLQELPGPPAFIRLVRITLQPGATVPMHVHPGPEFGRVESGILTVRTEGETVVAQADSGGTPQPPVVPPVGQEFELRPGDQIVYPTDVPFTFSNRGQLPATVLTALVVPAGHQRPPTSQWVGGTPAPEALLGVTSQILGDAVAPGWPPAPMAVVLDRLVLAPGETLPARRGPVMLAVELGQFGFALVEGQFQVSRGDSGPQPNATPGVAYGLNPGDAVFFPGGMNEVPRPGDDGVLVVLRLSVLPIDAGAQDATSAAAAGGTAAAPPPAATLPPQPPVPSSAGLAPGAAVVVTESGVRLRASPSASGEVVAELEEGRQMVVSGPPVDSDGIIWYPVQAADDPAVAGFIAEEFLAPPS